MSSRIAKKELIESISDLSTALEELQYAEDKNILNRNIDEIKEMIKGVDDNLDDILDELESIETTTTLERNIRNISKSDNGEGYYGKK